MEETPPPPILKRTPIEEEIAADLTVVQNQMGDQDSLAHPGAQGYNNNNEQLQTGGQRPNENPRNNHTQNGQAGTNTNTQKPQGQQTA